MSQNIFSLEGLISWLETQDPETTYTYTSSAHCLIATYLRKRGLPIMGCTHDYWRDNDFVVHYGEVSKLNPPARVSPHTYGAALTRARELLAEERQCPI